MIDRASKHTLAVILFSSALSAHAADTVCNNNGGAGWTITDGGITNLTIPFNFGDISRLHDVNINTDITHTWVGDLTARATSPQGTAVLLFERPGTAAGDTAPTDSGPYGCSGNNLNVTFDDEAATGTNIENICGGGTPSIQGTYRPHNGAPNNLGAMDGENPNGDWSFYLSDSANQDTGTLNQVCLTVAYSGITFDKWVSSNASCSDTIDSIAVAPGTNVYFCYTVLNPSTETFSINPGNWTDDKGHDLSGLETTYTQGASVTVVEGPIVAGTPALPVGTTVNNASVTATFATANFTGTLTTPETATAVVADPVINTSTKTVVDLNGGSAEPGDVLEYTVSINETAGIYTPNVQVSDVVDANLNTISFTTLPAGATNNTTGNNIDISGITLPAGGSAVIVYRATINAAATPGTAINNSAAISHAASGVSFNAIAPTLIVSAPDLSTSTKVELDVNGTPSLPGDLIRYTITINETGGNPASNVTVTDIIDANLINVNVVSIPLGATNNSVGNNLNISGFAVPANGSATLVVEANISGSTSVGTTISNSATITDTVSGISVVAVAGNIIVSSPATSGIKQLYLDNLNLGAPDLTRVAPVTNTNTGNFGAGGSVTINMTPVFRAPFTITGGTAVNLTLNVQRNGGGARTATVELYNGGTGALIGSDLWTWNANGTQYHNFSFTPASDVNFAVGDFVRMIVRNTGGGNFRVRSLVGGNQSQVSMDASTVINIDSLGVYAAAYPSTTQYQSYIPGSTVYLRATVSDPFGNADITSANISISDSAPTVRVNNAAMTSVATPNNASRIYEYQYTLPATPQGIWNVSVTANEGFEGTVAHTSQLSMIVGNPSINVNKTSQVISDPVNVTNPKAIPNSIVEYTLTVSNTGFGYADNGTVVITDPLPTGTTLFLGSPANPVQFANGSVSSGLSYTFTSLSNATDDISFSNNLGSTFITPSVDASGFDVTSPPINYIRINPKGSFRGSDGINNPALTLKFRVRVD